MRIRLFQILMVPIRVEGVRNAQFAAIIVLLHTAPVGNAKPTEIYDPTGLDFVLVELDLAATFCDLALSTQDQERKERNTSNARKAYDSARHYLQRLSPGSAKQALIHEKVSRLKDSLEQLGLNA
jgi:hypothetical protein